LSIYLRSDGKQPLTGNMVIEDAVKLRLTAGGDHYIQVNDDGTDVDLDFACNNVLMDIDDFTIESGGGTIAFIAGDEDEYPPDVYIQGSLHVDGKIISNVSTPITNDLLFDDFYWRLVRVSTDNHDTAVPALRVYADESTADTAIIDVGDGEVVFGADPDSTNTDVDLAFWTKGTGDYIFVNDAGGGTSFKIDTNDDDAINYMQVKAAGTGNDVIVSTHGDANVDLDVQPAGSGLFLYNGAEVLTGPSPSITCLQGANSNNVVCVSDGASTVNYVSVLAANAAAAPEIYATGTDSNIDLELQSKGTGSVKLQVNGANSIAEFVPATSAVNYFTITSSTIAADLSIAATGSDTNISIDMQPKGSGTLSVNGTDVSLSGHTHSYLANIVEDTTPQLGGNLDTNSQNIIIDDNHGILDDSNNEMLWFQKTTTATNHAEFVNASVLSQAVILRSAGSTSNMGFTIQTQGTGNFRVTDDGGDEMFMVEPVASGVNHVTVEQTTTGNGPVIKADGTDTNIDLVLETKGTGQIQVNDDVLLNTNITLQGGIIADYDPGGTAGTFTLTDQTGTTGGVRPALFPPNGFTTTNWVKVYTGTTAGYLVVFT